MRKFYLFLAGAFLALPLVAQNEPIRNPQTDPKVIYEQNFEDDFDAWSKAVVDTINGLNYFKNWNNPGTLTFQYWSDAKWRTGFIHRDTLIELRNGVMLTDNAKDIADQKFKDDVYTIVKDAEGDFSRKKALDEVYGINSGNSFFRFVSSKIDNLDSGKETGGVANYRRNLFIRALPIEDNSSYRVTMYLKATPAKPDSIMPKFSTEVMRGYFSSEKQFSMGYENDNNNYKYNNTFNYEKEFTDEDTSWVKVTYMTYYLNNEVANNYCYSNGYYDTWHNYWKWVFPKASDPSKKDSLDVILQPNKFFVRISFRSDLTTFDLDNISITKSTIGGIQHTGNLIRVDFGYQTNLKDQATAAKVRTNIPAVELPGQFFTVRGYKASTNKWQKIGISTAEYHDDGYLYMWAKPGAGGQTIKFESYDSVLVSFTNPVGVEYDTLSLKYTGSTFPNALDVDWIKAGKRVFDFTNEVSSPNPVIAKGVYPLKQYPVVIRPNGEPYEDGSFGLDPNLQSLKLTLSKKLDYNEDEDGSSEKAFCQVFKNGVLTEVWPVSESTDTYTIFKRKNTATPLSGDYTFKFVQLKGVSGDTAYGDDIVLNYHFGSFDKNPQLVVYAQSDWRSHLTDFTFGGSATSRPLPDNIYMHSGHSNDEFVKGEGTQSKLYGDKSGTKLGLYPLKDDTMIIAGTKVPDNCFFYLSSRKSPKTGNLYSIEHLNAGLYEISFKFAGRSSLDYPMKLYFYAKPAGDLENGNSKGFAVLEAVANKTVLEKGRKPVKADMGEGGFSQAWKDGTETLTYKFVVETEGDYVFEWVSTGSTSHYGVAIGNYWITNSGDLSFGPVQNLNKTIALAQAKIESITLDKYKGAAFEALKASKTAGDGFIQATITANKGHQPKYYAAQVKSMEDAIEVMQQHMDTVDLFYTAFDTVSKAVTAKASMAEVDAYKKLKALKEQYSSYNCQTKTNKEISDDADILNAAVKNLNTRIADTEDYAKLLERTKKIIDSSFVLFNKPTKFSGKSLFEHDTLNQAYVIAESKKTTINTLSDDEFFGYYDGLVDLTNAYLAAMDLTVVRTKQIHELYALADSLGYDFGNKKDSIASLIDDLTISFKRDSELEKVLREAAILQMYKKLAAGAKLDSLDVSALVPNYFMYTPGIIGTDVRKNSSGIYVFKASPSEAIPGWTVTFGGTAYPGFEEVKEWAEDGREFMAGVHFNNYQTGAVATKIEGLPEAYYTVRMNMKQNNLSNGYIKAVTDSTTLDVKQAKGTNPAVFKLDSVRVTTGSALEFSYYIKSQGSGAVEVKGMELMFLSKDSKVDYSTLIAAQQAKLDSMITFVAPVVVAAEPIAVQYYNLNGTPVVTPEPGKIIIRRTILSNGKSVAEKILVK